MSRILYLPIALLLVLGGSVAVDAFGLADSMLASMNAAAADSSSTIKPRYTDPAGNISFITQRVDNFNPQNPATYQQRYISKTTHYRAGGPLYVVLASLGPVSEYDLENLLATQVARGEGAAVFLLEQRYYGQSIPIENMTIENLQWLTVEQMLADAANFVQHIRTTTPGADERTPVIAVGRYFGGSLAIWLRQKYPHLIAGAWASSAPLVALQNHQLYQHYAAETIRELAGDECYASIEAGFAELEGIAVAGRLEELGRLATVCEEHPLRTQNDARTLFFMLSTMLSSVSVFRSTVGSFCGALATANSNQTVTPAEALIEAMNYFTYNHCVNVDYEGFVRTISETALNATYVPYAGVRPLTYQLCTEVGWWSTSDSAEQPFGSMVPLAFFTELCSRVFGEEIAGHAAAQAAQDRFNVEHGGLNPAVSNALFTHGSYDPNRSIEVTRDLSATATAMQIPYAGPYYDFYLIADYDSQSLIDVKLDIMAEIRSWNRR